MHKAKIMIARDDDGYNIKIEGRATFECSPPLKNFAENIITGIISKIILDFRFCSWMDSTFMGTLAFLGLQAKRKDVLVYIINIDNKNFKLLKELGIQNLFTFNEPHQFDLNINEWQNLNSKTANDTANTVLIAHKTLMSVDEQNIPRFQKVVELVKKEIDENK